MIVADDPSHLPSGARFLPYFDIVPRSVRLFVRAHAFNYAGGHFSFDALTMALTGGPAFLAVWLRLRTGSLVLPVVLHNLGNSISLFV